LKYIKIAKIGEKRFGAIGLYKSFGVMDDAYLF
jgi:hypothetical protein